MILHDYGKALLIALVVIVSAVLAGMEVLPADNVQTTITLVLGYLVGNGRAAVKGTGPSPVIGPSPATSPDGIAGHWTTDSEGA